MVNSLDDNRHVTIGLTLRENQQPISFESGRLFYSWFMYPIMFSDTGLKICGILLSTGETPNVSWYPHFTNGQRFMNKDLRLQVTGTSFRFTVVCSVDFHNCWCFSFHSWNELSFCLCLFSWSKIVHWWTALHPCKTKRLYVHHFCGTWSTDI